MVNKHFSLACHFCRKQHTKCDLTKPECLRCKKRGLKCPGYRDVNGFLFVDQSEKTVVRSKKKGRPPLPTGSETEESDIVPTSSTKIRDLSPDEATICVNYFFNTFLLKGRNPLTSRGHFDHVVKYYSQAAPSSPLALATETLSRCAFASAFDLSLDSPSHARSVVRASEAMRAAIIDPIQCVADETLMAALALDFSDFIVSRTKGEPHSNIHQAAAEGLVQIRRDRNLESDVAKCLLYATCSNALRQAIFGGAFSQDMVRACFTYKWAMDNANLAVQLDGLIAEALQLYWKAITLRELHPLTAQGEWQAMDTAVQGLMARLQSWFDDIPADWHPQRQVFATSDPCLSEIFKYQVCESYKAVDIAFIYNHWRCVYLLVSGLAQETHDGYQSQLVKDVLTSVPFFLFDQELSNPDAQPQYKGMGPWYFLLILDWTLWICRDSGLRFEIDRADLGMIEAMRNGLVAKSRTRNMASC